MKLIWAERAWEEYQDWISNDKKVLKRINSLIKDIQREPFDGIGSPEPLKHNLAGLWSRRIDKEHRLVYRVDGQGKERAVTIYQCKYHYRRD